jgi:tetratricopeptide (TPR) repeat protein
VLPIRISATENDESLISMVEGFRDHVISKLSKIPGIVVVASAGPSAHATRRRRSIETIRYQLLARLSQLAPGKHSLSVQLVEVQGRLPNAVRWAEVFLLTDHKLVSALATISTQVANALKLTLPDPTGPPRRDTGPDPLSYQRFLRSIGLLSTNKESDVTSGLALLKGVVKASPDFADGHALYGYASWRQYFAGWDGGMRALIDARLQAKDALQLDETCTWARMTLIRVCWDLGQHEQAIAEGIRAVEDAPGHVEARLALARALNNAGMADLALPLTEEVLAVDPSNVTAQKLLVWNLLMVRRLADAASRGTAYLKQHPDDSNTAWALTMAHALLGDRQKAAIVAERGLRADHANFSLWLLLGYVQLAAGDTSSASRTWERGPRAVVDRLGETSTNYRALAYVANMHAALGQRDQALDMVQRIEQADPYNGYLNYRLAHVVAELGQVERAVQLIESAIDSGFLSVQMLRCEERVCALARLAGDERYRIAARRLEARVDKLRTQYGELLPAVIAPVKPAGGNGASSPPS